MYFKSLLNFLDRGKKKKKFMVLMKGHLHSIQMTHHNQISVQHFIQSYQFVIKVLLLDYSHQFCKKSNLIISVFYTDLQQEAHEPNISHLCTK